MLSGPGRRALLMSLCGLLVALGTWSVPGPAAAATDDQLVLVLDSSGSMAERVGGRRKIDLAKRALSGVVGGLPDEARVGLRVYGAKVFERTAPGACTDSQLVVPIGTDNRPELRDAIDGYEPFGETPISYSLQQAAKDLGPDGKRTILLVSDGEETCDADPCATAATLAKADVEVKIDVVGLAVSGRTRDQLRCVAERGNGSYYDADSADDLTSSLDKLATRAFRPFRLTGTPVEGSVEPEFAPALGAGRYLDEFGVQQVPQLYTVARTQPGSTLHAGFTARPAGQVATAAVRFRNAAGQECGNGLGQAIAIGGGSPLVTGEVDSWSSTAEDPCNSEDELLLEVTSYADQLEGTPFELLVSEEPPVGSTDTLPPVQEEVRWQPMRAGRATEPPVPGTSLSDAPVLEPGTYDTTILTGESQVFAVPLDWGQRLQADVSIDAREGPLAEALGFGDTLDLQLLAANRGRYNSLRVQGLPERDYVVLRSGKPYRVARSTPEVRYLNRASTGETKYASVPGLQYVVLNMDAVRDQKPFLVPYRLVVDVVGEAGEGAPAYDGEASPSPTQSEDASPEAAPESSDTDASSESGEPDEQGAPVVLLSGLVVMLVAVAGSAYVLWRQRRRRAD